MSINDVLFESSIPDLPLLGRGKVERHIQYRR